MLLNAAGLNPSEFQQNMREIEAEVEAILLSKNAAECDEVFGKIGVMAGAVKDLIQVIDTGQPAARELFAQVESDFGEHAVTTAGYRINDAVFEPGARVPRLGEHTQEALTKLGYCEDEIAQFANDNIIRH